MSKVIDLLKDPSWWFSAFFVAIVASLLASFIKDWASDLLARFSSDFRKWNNRRAARNKRKVQRLSRDFELLTLAYMRILLIFLTFLFSTLMFMLIPVLAVTTINDPIFKQVVFTGMGQLSADTRLIFFSILTILFGLMSVLLCFSAASEYQIIAKAHKHYREKRISQLDEQL